MRSAVACTVGVLVALVAATGCSSEDADSGGALPEDATVTYAFQDSSVPPQYHRSYTLTVTQAESRIVVDSYGDVLADESAPTSTKVWQEISAGTPSIADLVPVGQVDGCAGGTSFDVEVTVPLETLVELSADLCGGDNDDVARVVTDWLAPARDQFPPMDELAPE